MERLEENKLNSKAPRGIITGTTTLEEYCSKNKKLPGEYRINGAIIPEISTTEKFWGVLILSAVFDTQIVIIAGGKMYIRDYTGNPNVWSGWKKYTYANLSSHLMCGERKINMEIRARP